MRAFSACGIGRGSVVGSPPNATILSARNWVAESEQLFDERRAIACQDVELAIDVDHRAPVGAAEPLFELPDFLAGLQLEALGTDGTFLAILFVDIKTVADDDA